MKKIFLIVLITVIGFLPAAAQILNYNELGILATPQSQDNTARSMAMKNSFGSLGGDLGAMSVNPAGIAVFNNSMMGITLSTENNKLTSDFYGTLTENNSKDTNLSQLGGVLVMNNINDNAAVSSIVFGINYHTLKQYDFAWKSSGVSNPTWLEDPMDLSIQYDKVTSQDYENITSGSQSELGFGVAMKYNDIWYLGASLNALNMIYVEDATRNEIASADNGDTVDAFESFWQEIDADGVNLGVGVIVKPSQNIRLGLSYTTPSWYTVQETNNMFAENDDDYKGYYNLIYSNDPEPYKNSDNKTQGYDFEMKTPSKWTGSMAYVFNSVGLVSMDITRMNYAGLTISPKSEFEDVNYYFSNDLRNTTQINLGTEWRFNNLSVRGGYSVAQNPFMDSGSNDLSSISDNPENLQGYALGAGYKFGRFALDIAYDFTEKVDYFNYYSDIKNINAAELSKNKSKYLATLTYNF